MITAEQKLARATRIGSSDCAAVLGVDPERSPADVWLDKTARDPGFSGNEATERGNWMEPALIKFAASKLNKVFIADQMFIHDSDLLCANLDAISKDKTEAVEAKSTIMGDDWGDDDTDETPMRVTAQVYHQFACVPSLRVIWVPMAIPVPIGRGRAKFDFRMYRHERKQELVEQVEAQCLAFMRTYVVPGIKPTDYRPSLEVLERMHRVPKSCAEVAAEIYAAWEAARQERLAAEKLEEKAKATLLAQLGDAESGSLPDGRVFTYFSQEQERVDTKRLRAEYPEIAAACIKEICFRKLQPAKALKK